MIFLKFIINPIFRIEVEIKDVFGPSENIINVTNFNQGPISVSTLKTNKQIIIILN